MEEGKITRSGYCGELLPEGYRDDWECIPGYLQNS